jgi:glycosyltransferase involved in cell wall biosynthesis
MKVLIDVDHAFSWAHGGVQVLVENLLKNLPDQGVDVEPLRWWDETQTGEILHLMYPASEVHLFAKRKGLKIICSLFLDHMASESRMRSSARRMLVRGFQRFLPNQARSLGWKYPEICDGYIYSSKYEAVVGGRVFGAPIERSHVILHGVEDRYFAANAGHDSDFLISVGTIQERKNTTLLARAAKKAEVPIEFVGKPYYEGEYFKAFLDEVDGRFVRYTKYLDEESKIEHLRKARGFVLLSKGESGCIAALEALATGCPVLLANLPWAHSVYQGHASFANTRNVNETARQLREFYNTCSSFRPRYRVLRWNEVAQRYKEVYSKLLG